MLQVRKVVQVKVQPVQVDLLGQLGRLVQQVLQVQLVPGQQVLPAITDYPVRLVQQVLLAKGRLARLVMVLLGQKVLQAEIGRASCRERVSSPV